MQCGISCRGDVFETRLKASHHLREIANGYFRAGDFERALVVYERSWWHSDFDQGFIKLARGYKDTKHATGGCAHIGCCGWVPCYGDCPTSGPDVPVPSEL